MMTWPNKTQRRVLRELAEVTITDDSAFPEDRLAKRLDMPVEEVRIHLRALADLGMVEEAR
jgi:DNA-binding transcriptional ArsR family regulator